MKVINLDLSENKGFLHDYMENSEKLSSFFDYHWKDQNHYQKRLQELENRDFQRQVLCDFLMSYHQQLPYPKKVLEQIEKLRNPKAVAVVGGQQAGLLTGPMYTFYKAVTAIMLARQQEEKLSVPVVPIFWVAGEDHDLDEIRFVYTQKKSKWVKHTYETEANQSSASLATLDQTLLSEWIETTFSRLPETEFTKELNEHIHILARDSKTFTEFFSKIMNWLFQDFGLILLDAHAPEIRKLEIDFFAQLIERAEEVQASHKKGVEAFAEAGYGSPIETEKENAHLFYEYNGERSRLDYADGSFYIRDTTKEFSKQELLEELKRNPESFSNNVVTRPLMQEYLLPVLTFVAGPGELKYWATLKECFHLFSFKVPPVTPRVQMTVVPKMVEKWMNEQSFSYLSFLKGESAQRLEEWLEQQYHPSIEQIVEDTKSSINTAHSSLRELADSIDYNVGKLAEKNLEILNREIDFVKKRMIRHVKKEQSYMISKFEESGHWLAPNNRPQERVIHPLILLNLVGRVELSRLIELTGEVDGAHKLIFL
ncbi:bacillithiol biosynthesis cysteine-adding enzyme BshC [Alkalihalobacillus trypoxylicola]|uniref:Putative cysteine ligase BshC n=1 Tax=Alkalihalobacillus trypoxylicola TaxID=519424 RepID=A0A162FAY3_9BACI|nr:bacillithiol biosynthesis cysteine-adding enzyme BshC [Alkalihalobacillus trypoxylicola]KYG35184.1 hypothetical protein AZF04_02270 [Alkalihalobacillus trypoxylicola]